MNLLILTQKIDLDDDVLGFFHDWVLEFVKHCDKITVICLEKGKYELPDNVTVLSLGKEEHSRKSVMHALSPAAGSKVHKVWGQKLGYISRFYKYIWQERKNYDAVFVHMNPEYVVLGGPLWKLWHKKIVLWYNHKYGKNFARIAGYFSDHICCTSPFSFFAKCKKSKIMPVGIDTDLFKPKLEIHKTKNSLLFLGRISPVKNIEVLIDACGILHNRGLNFILNIVGSPLEKDKTYYEKLQNLVFKKGLQSKVKFSKKVPNTLAPEIFSRNEYFVNLTNSGSMDKTIFEAMACSAIVMASNLSLEDLLPEDMRKLMLFEEKNESDLAGKISVLFSLAEEEKIKISEKSRAIVVEKHDKKLTIAEIIKLFQKR